MENTEQRERKPVERSASYPSLTANQAIDFVAEISKHYTATQIISREDMAVVLKKAAPTIIRDVSAAAQYGLFTKHKNGYQISQLYKDYCNPISPTEKAKFLLDIFSTPKLFKELIDKYDGHGVPPDLKPHLIRFHSITEKAAPEAAEVFFESARYAGVLSDNNVLSFADTYNRLSSPGNVQYAEVITEDIKQRESDGDASNIPNRNSHQPLLLPEGSTTEEKVRIPLSDKKVAYLLYPSDINEKDIKILLKQIELLELTIM